MHIVKSDYLQFIKSSIDCKDEMLVLLSFERNLCQD